MNTFQEQIEKLDPGLFGHVLSQSTERDKRSLLALQWAMRTEKPNFVYLEIGSYMGGSLQPYLVDPLCSRMISIDSRPRSLPDVRGKLSYRQNTTENMLNQLRRIPHANLARIVTFDNGTEILSPDLISCRPDFCFIDGEHTDSAVLRDARFCQSVLSASGCIAFHDANIVYQGIGAFIDELSKKSINFRAFHLLDSVLFIEFGECQLSEFPCVTELQRHNCQGYLWSLATNDIYRQFYNKAVFRAYRSARARLARLLKGPWRKAP